MSKSRIPSPARSQGGVTPRRLTRGTRSMGSPAGSTSSVRLTSLIDQFKEKNQDSFALSPLTGRRSVLTDNTDIEEPKRKSWWKNLNENSRDVLEVLSQEAPVTEANNMIEELMDVEVLSQEKKNYTLDLPESSDNESINSIVLPQRRLFTQKENQHQKKFGQLVGARETLDKLQKSTNHEKTITAKTKELFQGTKRSKPIFPSALLDVTPNKTVGDKTKENIEPKPQVRTIFGNRPNNKRKNIFADFIASESEDEISEIQPKVFGFQKKSEQKRISSVSKGRESSPSSMTTDIETDFMKFLPSSTMMENQLEQMLPGQTPKRARLSKLSEGKESDGATIDNTRSKSTSKNKSTNDSRITRSQSRNSSKINHSKTDKKHDKTDSKDSIEKDDANNVTVVNKTERVNKSKNLTASKDANSTKSSKTLNTSETNKNKSQKNDKTLKENDIKNKSKVTAILNDEQVEDDINFTLTYEGDENEVADELDAKLDAILNPKKDNISLKNISVAKSKSLNEKHIAAAELNKTAGNVGKHGGKDESKQGKELTQINDDENEIYQAKEVVNEEMHQEDHQKIQSNIVTDDEVNDKQNADNEDNIIDHQENNINDSQKVENEEHKISKSDQELENKDDSKNQEIENESINQSQEVQNEDIIESQEINEDQVNESEEENEAEASQVVENEEANETEEENEGEASAVVDDEDEGNESEPDNEAEASEVVEDDEANESEQENEAEAGEAVEDDEVNESEEENENEASQEVKNEEGNETQEHDEDIDENNVSTSQVASNYEDQDDQNEAVCDDNKENDAENQEVEEENLKDVEENQEVNTESQEINNENQAESEDESENAVHSEAEMSDNQIDDVNQESDGENQDDDENQETDDQNQAESDDNDDDNAVHSDAEMSDQIDEEMEVDNPDQESDGVIDGSPNITHDTTGRNRNKPKSPEAILQSSNNQMDSFLTKGRNTSIRRTSIKSLNIRPSLAPPRESTGFSDKDSSAEGSGWDSHRTTRKTIRQTLGKEYTMRKSLRALVMEKSARRHTTMGNTEYPLANSTEQENCVDIVDQSDHEISRQIRQDQLENYLQKIKQQNMEKKLKMEEAVRNSLKTQIRDPLNLFKVPTKPPPRRLKTTETKKKTKSTLTLGLPSEVIEDLKYKPPKRFQPTNASWITRRLYKFLESKLEAKYDYKARIRAEKLVETIYSFVKSLRRCEVAPPDAVDVLKHELARLDIVKTHFEFYEFFREFMPREVRIKVNPDIINKIPLPRHGVFTDIIRGNSG